MKVTRRGALKSVGVLGIASAIGCDDASVVPGPDAGADAGAERDGGAHDGGGPPTRDGGPAPTGPFRHGVASGDPLPDGVILWTRVTVEGAASVSVDWEVSRDPAFAAIDAMGAATTDASRDFTVKIDVTGLAPATTYYYRFRVAGEPDTSPIGRTRTAPDATTEVAQLRFAVVSCASYAHGWFHAYKNIAERADLDAVIHLGDYIYEYGDGEYGSLRSYDPPHECLTLEDYRRRYAHYRSDPDVAAIHRQHPFVCVWDDHELANNAYRDGAENHDETEGDWSARKAAAQQAYSEWLPLRAEPARIHRTLRFGGLCDLVMLDTRVEGRSEQGAGDAATRTLLSSEQEDFLIESIATSTARWKLIAQQVVFSPVPVLFNSDAWDGYPAQRARILDAIRTQTIEDVLVLTGDIHMSFAVEVVADPEATPLEPLAIELVAPGVTSPALAPGPITDSLVRTIERDVPYAKHYDLVSKGYFVLDLAETGAQADFVVIADPTAPYDTSESVRASWRVEAGTRALERAAGPLPPVSEPPALAP